MATRDSGGVGMNHLTVVPENPDPDPATEDESESAADVTTEDDHETE